MTQTKRPPANPGRFSDKRTGYLAGHTFLELNGYDVAPTEADIVTVIMGVADGTYDEGVVAAWLRDCSQPKAR